jgi:ferritin
VLSQAVQDAINEQIKHELYSAYLYLAMSAHCQANNLPGSAQWTALQSKEEVGHAMKFFGYINDRGGRVLLQAIDQPPTEWKSLLAMFQQVLEHEQKVTGLIHRLYEVALKEKDYATQIELQWFIAEQVEEEKNAGEIVEQLKRVGEQGPGLMMTDRHLGKRGAGD